MIGRSRYDNIVVTTGLIGIDSVNMQDFSNNVVQEIANIGLQQQQESEREF